jgi:hypothetical protein
MSAKSSPELLVNLFARFQRRAKAETGVKVSMRKVSEWLLAPPLQSVKRKPDANALGRWTNPGGRPNWFIPVGRVLDVARQLGASPEERDALMLARIAEIAKADPKHDVVVCGTWVAERVTEQHRLNDDEQAVLDAYRKSCAVSPYRMMTPNRLARLQHVLEELAREHLAELASEQDNDAEPEHLSSETEGQFRDRRAVAMRVLLASRAPTRKPEQLSAEVLARRFLRSLRKAPPSAAN